MLARFYWLVHGQIAGCSRPGAAFTEHRGVQPDEMLERDLATIDRDLSWLREQGIAAILSLTETPLAGEMVARHGMALLHLPVPDLQAPTPEEIGRALNFIDQQRAFERPVAVHCLMGQGRTGTILAAYRIRAGVSPDEALRELRTICPGAVSSPAQERALHAFAARREWIL